jgi:hypothetical protein
MIGPLLVEKYYCDGSASVRRETHAQTQQKSLKKQHHHRVSYISLRISIARIRAYYARKAEKRATKVQIGSMSIGALLN